LYILSYAYYDTKYQGSVLSGTGDVWMSEFYMYMHAIFVLLMICRKVGETFNNFILYQVLGEFTGKYIDWQTYGHGDTSSLSSL
jgi:hypothetical protein